MSNQNQSNNQIVVDTTVKFGNILVAGLQHSCVTASRTIKLEELGVEIDYLPAGSRKLMQIDVIPAEFLKVYDNYIVQAKTIFDRYTANSRCDIGYVVAHSQVTKLREEIQDLIKRLNERKEDDGGRYEEIKANHLKLIAADQAIKDFPERERLLKVIESKQPAWSEIDAGIHLAYTLLAVGPVGEWDIDAYQDMQDSVVAIKKGAFGSLIQELCKASRKALETALKAETRVHSRTVKSVWNVVEKLGEFAFIDKRLRVVEVELRRFLSPLHTGEALRGMEYEDFINIMSALSNQVWVVQKLDSGEPLIESLDDELPWNASSSSESVAAGDEDQQAYASAFESSSETQVANVEDHVVAAVEEAVEESPEEKTVEESPAPVPQVQPTDSYIDTGF